MRHRQWHRVDNALVTDPEYRQLTWRQRLLWRELLDAAGMSRAAGIVPIAHLSQWVGLPRYRLLEYLAGIEETTDWIVVDSQADAVIVVRWDDYQHEEDTTQERWERWQRAKTAQIRRARELAQATAGGSRCAQPDEAPDEVPDTAQPVQREGTTDETQAQDEREAAQAQSVPSSGVEPAVEQKSPQGGLTGAEIVDTLLPGWRQHLPATGDPPTRAALYAAVAEIPLPDWTRERWELLPRYLAQSHLLAGRAKPRRGHRQPFVAQIPWAIERAERIASGEYHGDDRYDDWLRRAIEEENELVDMATAAGQQQDVPAMEEHIAYLQAALQEER